MTKTYDLTMGGDGNYYLKSRRACCCRFICTFCGKTPAKITVEISDTKLDDWNKLMVCRTGRYRWQAQATGYPWQAMFLVTEEEIGSFFPLGKDDPADDGSKLLTLWFSIHE